MIFSYTLLFEYNYDVEEVKVQTINYYTDNITNITNTQKGTMTKLISKLNITFYEILLLVWILSIVGEEIRQV
jgi:hypothetical protein